jgi:hypothetical protein
MTIWEELECIPALVRGTNPKTLDIHNIRANKLSTSIEERKKWIKQFEEVIKIVDNLGIDYVLIKYYDLPFVCMQDIDLLIEKQKDRHILFSALKDEGFTPYQQQPRPIPEKIDFIKDKYEFPVDIYPKTAWWKISYAPKDLIPSTSIVKELSGIKVNLPSPTYDLYMIITHTYSHGVITLADIAQVTKHILENKVDWDHIILLAKRYMLEHVMYLYLLVVNHILSQLGRPSREIKRVLAIFGKTWLSRKLGTIIEPKTRHKHFPLKIPLSLRVLSALREISVSSLYRRKATSRELKTYWLMVIQMARGHSRIIAKDIV